MFSCSQLIPFVPVSVKQCYLCIIGLNDYLHPLCWFLQCLQLHHLYSHKFYSCPLRLPSISSRSYFGTAQNDCKQLMKKSTIQKIHTYKRVLFWRYPASKFMIFQPLDDCFNVSKHNLYHFQLHLIFLRLHVP